MLRAAPGRAGPKNISGAEEKADQVPAGIRAQKQAAAVRFAAIQKEQQQQQLQRQQQQQQQILQRPQHLHSNEELAEENLQQEEYLRHDSGDTISDARHRLRPPQHSFPQSRRRVYEGAMADEEDDDSATNGGDAPEHHGRRGGNATESTKSIFVTNWCAFFLLSLLPTFNS